MAFSLCFFYFGFADNVLYCRHATGRKKMKELKLTYIAGNNIYIAPLTEDTEAQAFFAVLLDSIFELVNEEKRNAA